MSVGFNQSELSSLIPGGSKLNEREEFFTLFPEWKGYNHSGIIRTFTARRLNGFPETLNLNQISRYAPGFDFENGNNEELGRACCKFILSAEKNILLEHFGYKRNPELEKTLNVELSAEFLDAHIPGLATRVEAGPVQNNAYSFRAAFFSKEEGLTGCQSCFQSVFPPELPPALVQFYNPFTQQEFKL